jgi:hypothetical protein
MSKAAELAALIGSQTALSNRNLVIGGCMRVAQRGTSETGITSSRYANAPDRHKITVVSGGTWTASQTTTAPSGFSNSYKLECTATSTNTAMAVRLEHRFEGQNLQHLQKGTASAKSVTLSFWVRSSTTGTYIANLTDLDNTRQISQSYTISTADTWEYKTLTFAGDTTGVLDNDNANSLRIEWWLAAGTDYTTGTLQTSWAARVDANQAVGQTNLAATANNDWYITGVQLEVGETATPFEHRSYGEELKLCKRYYTQGTSDEAGATRRRYASVFSGIHYGGSFFYETEMRTDATVTLSGFTFSGATAIAVAFPKKTGFVLQMTSSTGSYYANSGVGTWTANAEL